MWPGENSETISGCGAAELSLARGASLSFSADIHLNVLNNS